jgi:hypothetical protein
MRIGGAVWWCLERAQGMTMFEFYAFIALPALLVVGAYIAVIIYERRSRSDSDAVRNTEAKSVSAGRGSP